MGLPDLALDCQKTARFCIGLKHGVLMISYRKLNSVLGKAGILLALVGGISVLILAVLIAYDILARKLLAFSVQGTDELGGYVLALVGSLGMSHVLHRREFTRIDLAFRLFPIGLQRILHVLAYVSLAGMVLFLAYHAQGTLNETLLFQSHANTPLQTPLWIPQGLWVLGIWFFALNAVLQALRAVLLLITDPSRVEREFGTVQIESELADYTAARPGTDTPA